MERDGKKETATVLRNSDLAPLSYSFDDICEYLPQAINDSYMDA